MLRPALLLALATIALWSSPGLAHEGAEPLVDDPHDEEATVLVLGTSREAEPASTDIVTQREIEANPGRTADDALRGVPGLALVQHGSEGKGVQFFVRGFDAGHGADFAFSVEGIPVNEWSNVHANGYVDLGFVIPEVIRKVVVKKGPFSLEQGAFANAGSASYTLGVAEDERGLGVGYTIGTTNRQRLLLTYAPTEGDGNSFVAAEALHDDGFGAARGLRKATGVGKWQLDLGAHQQLGLFAAATTAAFELPGALRNRDVAAGRLGFYDSYDTAQGGQATRGLLALDYRVGSKDDGLTTRVFGSLRELSLLDNFTGFLLDDVNGDRRRQAQAAASLGTDITVRSTWAPGLVLVSGLGATLDVLEQAEVQLGRELEELEERRALAATQMLAHARLGLEMQPHESLRLNAGLRGDVARVLAEQEGLPTGSGTLAAPLPRLGAEWSPSDAWRLTAAYGRGFRPPEARAFSGMRPPRTGITDDLFRGGPPALTVVDMVELGTRLRPSRYFGAALSGFAAFVEREAVYDHVSGMNLELNGTRRLGGELDVHSHPFDWLVLGADVSLVDARFVESQNPIPLVPWMTFGARALITHESGLRAGLRLVGWAPRALPHGARGSSYALLGGTLGYHWPRLHLDLAVENILDLAMREGEYAFGSNWEPGPTGSQLPVLHYAPAPPRLGRLTVTGYF